MEKKNKQVIILRGTVIFIDVFLALRLPDYYNRNKYAFAFILLAIIISLISLIIETVKRKKILK